MALPMLWTRRNIASDAEAVWSLLTDTARWHEWGPTVRGGHLDEPGRFEDGATGRVQTVAGFALPFELTDVHEGRRWSWKVAGIPATVHTVDSIDGGARVGMGVPAPAAAYLPVCMLAVRRIDRILTGR